MNYARLIQYLDAIATPAIDVSRHGPFWRNADGAPLPYAAFVGLEVPGGVTCNNAPVRVINIAHPTDSPLLRILLGDWCNNPQMPFGVRKITDDHFEVELDSGERVTGQNIQRDILEWLNLGYPEH
jgi:hypothetical protein